MLLTLFSKLMQFPCNFLPGTLNYLLFSQLLVVIDRYWFFITDTDTNYLYVYVPDNRYAEPIFIYCDKVNK